MTQAAVSATFSRFEHMSPQGAGLALLLHAAVALAIWWSAPIHSHDEPEQAIEVTMEEPPVPQPEASQPVLPPAARLAPPATPSARPQAPSVPLGLPPTPPPPAAAGKPQPEAPPQPQAAPQPSLEHALPPVDTPPPPATANELPVPVPPPPAPEARPKPAPQTPPPPAPPAPSPRSATLQPSPLSRLPQQRVTPGSQSATSEPQTVFINPADQRRRASVAEEYLQQVIYKVSQHRVYLPGADESGVIGVRFTISVDGRLINVSIAHSSGKPVLDNATLEAFRSASPYPPLPPELARTGSFTHEMALGSRRAP